MRRGTCLSSTQENYIFNNKNFFIWVTEELEAVIISLFCFYLIREASLDASRGWAPTADWSDLPYANLPMQLLYGDPNGDRQAGNPPASGQGVFIFSIIILSLPSTSPTRESVIPSSTHKFCMKVRQFKGWWANQDQLNNYLYSEQISLYITGGLTEQEKHWLIYFLLQTYTPIIPTDLSSFSWQVINQLIWLIWLWSHVISRRDLCLRKKIELKYRVWEVCFESFEKNAENNG